MYENNELDTAAPPLPEMDRVRADPELSQELSVLPLSCTYFYGFINTKYPMTDARVRLAFSQAIDRQSLVDNVLKVVKNQLAPLLLRVSLVLRRQVP
jgi:oligopeptide transport system substrate-binding protein